LPTTSPPSSRSLAARLGLAAVATLLGAALVAAPVCVAAAQGGHDAHAAHGAADGQAAPGAHPAPAPGTPEAHGAHPAPAPGIPEAHGAHPAPAPDAPAHDHEAMQARAERSDLPVGVDEHLGAYVPLDTVFTDSQGHETTLGQAMGAPTFATSSRGPWPGFCPGLA
jgi:hypothetical protein